MELETEVEEYWSGNVDIKGEEYEFSIDVILNEFGNDIEAITTTEKNKGQNYVRNAQKNNFIEGDTGLGVIGSVLFMKKGDQLNPRKYSASHEIGHLLGLPDRGAGDRSIMGYLENRGSPKKSDRQQVIDNLEISTTGPQIIEGYKR